MNLSHAMATEKIVYLRMMFPGKTFDTPSGKTDRQKREYWQQKARNASGVAKRVYQARADLYPAPMPSMRKRDKNRNIFGASYGGQKRRVV